jgi:hypothetical protein
MIKSWCGNQRFTDFLYHVNRGPLSPTEEKQKASSQSRRGKRDFEDLIHKSPAKFAASKIKNWLVISMDPVPFDRLC